MNVLTIRLTNWAESNGVIVESQEEFRKDYSTIDNIFSLNALIQKYLCRERGGCLCIKPAFDGSQQKNLWHSLESKGIAQNKF